MLQMRVVSHPSVARVNDVFQVSNLVQCFGETARIDDGDDVISSYVISHIGVAPFRAGFRGC